jgi:hypothetical protein
MKVAHYPKSDWEAYIARLEHPGSPVLYCGERREG